VFPPICCRGSTIIRDLCNIYRQIMDKKLVLFLICQNIKSYIFIPHARFSARSNQKVEMHFFNLLSGLAGEDKV